MPLTTNKKRVLIFSLAYHPLIGGAEVAVKEITDRLAHRSTAEGLPEIEFDLVTLRFSKDHPTLEKVGNVNVHRIKATKLTFPIEAMLYAKKLHKKTQYDAIWSIMAARAGGAALFFKYSFPRVPFILTLQEGDPVSYMKLRSLYYVNPFFKKIFTNADIIQAISNYLADYARTMGYKGRVEVIPNGVNVEKFKAESKESRREIRSELGYSDEDTILITTSRLETKNSVGDIINALHFLPPEVKLIIAGTGSLEERLREKIKKQNLVSRVVFLGSVPNEEIPQYLKASDIFVRPSQSEGFGISFIEAMAAGLPVIATPVGGIVDFLFDPDDNPDKEPTGLFTVVREPEATAKQVSRLMKDKDLRNTLVENGKRLVKEKFEWDLVARQMRERVFDQVLSGR